MLGRYGGLGSHRYPLGFSGDVDEVSWTTLRFSIYMTGCSTNAAYGVWSHDILGPLCVSFNTTVTAFHANPSHNLTRFP